MTLDPVHVDGIAQLARRVTQEVDDRDHTDVAEEALEEHLQDSQPDDVQERAGHSTPHRLTWLPPPSISPSTGTVVPPELVTELEPELSSAVKRFTHTIAGRYLTTGKIHHNKC